MMRSGFGMMCGLVKPPLHPNILDCSALPGTSLLKCPVTLLERMTLRCWVQVFLMDLSDDEVEELLSLLASV